MSGLIDLANWKRREHFELFRRASQPWFSITAEVDVTTLRERCDADDGPSFFLSALYACLSAANAIEAFRLRLRGDAVWVHDIVGVTSTILRDDETFGIGSFEMTPDVATFVRQGVGELRRVRSLSTLELPQSGDDALVYHSTIPWVRFTAFTNAITDQHDSVPRIVFGRWTRTGDRIMMPVSAEVHHALVDGLDVGRFFETLRQNLESIS